MEKVKHELMAKNVGRESLIIVDVVQRLGIDYAFKEEIVQVLQREYMAMDKLAKIKDLYFVSLCFRLFRQHHYYVSADTFDNFVNIKRKLELMGESNEALMSLFEASQLRMEGEDVLDEAEFFSRQLLEERLKFLDHDQAITIRNTLAHPHHKSFARITEKHLITNVINGKAGYAKALQELAVLDIAVRRTMHEKELCAFSRWWNDLGLAQELKLVRDQPLKWYMSTTALLTDPSFYEERIELAKSISLIYIIDDIFDLYGTISELTLFTEAVNRWDIEATEQLPDYMQKCFSSLHKITTEIGYKIYKKHGLDPIAYLKIAWTKLCNAFLEESKWFASGHLPKAEEYLNNGIISSGVHVVLVHLFFLIGDGSTKEKAELMISNPSILSYPAAILRLWDDLGSAKDENQKGHDGSYIACYMKEHQEASVETARKHVQNMISDTWKCLNKESLSPNPYSKTFINGCLNLVRMVPLMYSYDDNQSLPLLEEYIKGMFK
ncbi:Nerolidol synthesis [Heracleum sosnowskyi]|uniref:Nerolidol synthesis n=1 Tax=Heracleum sosnowskyi TaxID=360622 RepID=A0AAD8IJM2_9APIA|nr:Nerolidol synthesis [Heracleum sosnowskyi]